MSTFAKKRWILLTGAAALFLVILGMVLFGLRSAPGSYIAIDVNPGVELQTDRLDRVTWVRATNTEAQQVLDGLHLEGLSLEDAVEDVMDRIVALGYLGEDQSNDILLTVSGGDKEQALLQRINAAIDTTLKGKQLEARIHTQGLASVEELRQQADQAGVSAGKYAIIQKIMQEDGSVSAGELASLRVSELFAYAKAKNISFDDVIDEFEDAVEDTLLTSSGSASSSPAPSSAPAPKPESQTPSSVPVQSSASDTSSERPNRHQHGSEKDYCDYCGKPESQCRNQCKQYCDDCGRPRRECRDRCDNDGPDYCKYCGRLEAQCKGTCEQYCDDCGQLKSQCQGHWDRDDDDDEYCEGCGQLESVCREQCGAYRYCEDCGKLKTECQDRCDVDGPDYCEACGQLESTCQDRCEGHRYCDDCGRLKTECRGRCDD